MIARRTMLLSTLGCMAPFAARAQAPARPALVGYISVGTREPSFERAFLDGLRESGLVAGRDVEVELHYAGGDIAGVRPIAEALIARRASVIVTGASIGARIVNGLTADIPIVFAADFDPVGSGLVASLARPGGNITGFSLQSTELDVKRVEMLREIVPGMRRIGVMFNPTSDSYATRRGPIIAQAAGVLGLTLVELPVRDAAGLDEAFAAAVREGAGGVLVLRNFAIEAAYARIVELAARHRLPAIYEQRVFVEAGGLLSHGPDIADLHRRAARYVARILRGAKPADLPVEQAETFRLVINLKTARALGIAIPPALLVRADEVIE